MKAPRTEILEYVLRTIEDLSQDGDYTREVGPQTLLFRELGMESLDVVVLGTAIQEHYQFQMPFAELLADVGQRASHDLSISELVDFVDLHLNANVPTAGTGIGHG